MNPLKTLENLGQSVWLDFISRQLLESGDLAKLISDDGLRGVTSNPAIFEKAISNGTEYDALIAKVKTDRKGQSVGLPGGVLDAKSLYESLAIKDIQDAAN